MGQEAADQDWRSTGRSRSTGASPSPTAAAPLLYRVTEPRPRRTDVRGSVGCAGGWRNVITLL